MRRSSFVRFYFACGVGLISGFIIGHHNVDHWKDWEAGFAQGMRANVLVTYAASGYEQMECSPVSDQLDFNCQTWTK